jgi:transposase
MYVEIQSALHFLWLRGASNEQIMSQIKEMYRDGVIYFQSVQRWTHDFAMRGTELDALPRHGRPTDSENADRIRELLESKPYFPQETLSRRLNLHHDIVHRILTEELGLCKVNFKGIPHSLTESHKQEGFEISMELL